MDNTREKMQVKLETLIQVRDNLNREIEQILDLLGIDSRIISTYGSAQTNKPLSEQRSNGHLNRWPNC